MGSKRRIRIEGTRTRRLRVRGSEISIRCPKCGAEAHLVGDPCRDETWQRALPESVDPEDDEEKKA